MNSDYVKFFSAAISSPVFLFYKCGIICVSKNNFLIVSNQTSSEGKCLGHFLENYVYSCIHWLFSDSCKLHETASFIYWAHLVSVNVPVFINFGYARKASFGLTFGGTGLFFILHSYSWFIYLWNQFIKYLLNLCC